MVNKILITQRGDQPHSGAATKSNRQQALHTEAISPQESQHVQ